MCQFPLWTVMSADTKSGKPAGPPHFRPAPPQLSPFSAPPTRRELARPKDNLLRQSTFLVRRASAPLDRASAHSFTPILAAVPLDATRSVIDDCAILCGRILQSTEDDIASAAEAVERTLAHPLLDRARGAEARGECRRETPITLKDDAGFLIEGVVDLAFGEPGGWIVVDFKTDTDLLAEHAPYERQVAIYAEAIGQSTGQRCSGILLRI